MVMNIPDEEKSEKLRIQINNILSSELETAINMIKDNKDKLDRLVNVLLEKIVLRVVRLRKFGVCNTYSHLNLGRV